MDPCYSSSDHNTQMPSVVISCSQKKRAPPREEESGFQFEFKLLSSLPDQMLLEILIRLPMKCATRYKVVCRHWCSLISSRHFISMFINLHRQRYSKDTPDSFTIVFKHEVRAPSPHGIIKHLYPVEAVSNHLELSESYENKSVNLNFLPRFRPKYEGSDYSIIYPDSEPICVSASCHDLMLCSHFTTYYVVNLLTRQWIALPTVPNPIRERIHAPRCSILGQKSGLLCYHDESDINNGYGWYRFKVILIPVNAKYYCPEKLQKMIISGPPEICSEICASEHNIQIYCSETRQWTDVIVDWFPLQLNYYLCYGPILAYDRMLHCLIGRTLVALDLFSGDAKLSISQVIKLPDEFLLDHSLCFGVCVGRLRVACRVIEEGSGPVIHIWELEDRSRGSWSPAHKVVLRKLEYRSRGLNLIAFHPFNRDVIFFKEAQKIHLYNMRTGKLMLYRELKLSEGCRCGGSVKVVPPILHQWFPTPVPSLPPVHDTYKGSSCMTTRASEP